jgi:hypothetical protein
MKEYFETRARYLKLDIPVPYKEMLKEAQALRHRFTDHRGNESNGWMSLALYGLDENRHENWSDYGYASAAEAAKDFKWTDASKECPVTMNFLLNHFPSKKYGRVRFMLVTAGGYIGLHRDSKSMTYLTENINIALNNPLGCVWRWGDGEPDLIMEEGGAYAMNITYEHSVVNTSNEDRFHLIIARHDATPEWKALIDKAAVEQGVEGRYITLNDLP